MEQNTEYHYMKNFLTCNQLKYKSRLYMITGFKKLKLTLIEYMILTNPEDIEMYQYYLYLNYILYLNFIPCSPLHYQKMNEMISKLSSREKKIKQKEKSKKK